MKVSTAPIDSVLGEVDAVITAGNSYGEMSGGVDRAVAAALPGVQRAVWAHMAERHLGYQPVGTADVVPTGYDKCRWLVYAPTMRVPRPLTHGRDIAVHDAFWAELVAISRHNANSEADRISAVACPGFGTGYG
ncbi:phage tail protein [Kribbella turkmenica]|uniref:Phage tail protein n=1 Tax=Kribbella turkmenica TaxID=2530375 RepID=A0A4R4XGA2_9ACTN|nr:macro domain-containing protein [Kribbella turkmenica]TDD29770.1 phage tail protein [Kribbella turkmenica]